MSCMVGYGFLYIELSVAPYLFYVRLSIFSRKGVGWVGGGGVLVIIYLKKSRVILNLAQKKG